MQKKTLFSILICIFAAALLLVIVSAWVNQNYLYFNERLLRRNSEVLDLRHMELAPEDVDELHGQLPGTKIIWNVPFQGLKDSQTQELQISSLTMEELDMLDYLPALTFVDASGCTDYEVLEALQARRPECEVNYQVIVGGTAWDESAERLELKDPDADELTRQIPYLKKLIDLRLTGQLPEAEALFRLRDSFPHIEFVWELSIGDQTADCYAEVLDLSGTELTYEEAHRIMSLLPQLKEADMQGCGLTDEEMMSLADSFPECFLIWEMEAFGQTFRTDVTELDITGFKLDSTEPIEQLLPYLKKLEKVDMSHCGLDDETMDALNRRYPDVRILWSVYIKGFYIRTDATYFYPYKLNTELYVSTQDLYPLRYCTDIICIDIGHQTAVHNCDWAAYMPDLQYLIIAHTSITDLSPLVNCKKLKYLEIFMLDLKDYSPLLELTALEDLNMGCTYADPAPIAKMTWLKNLWWFDAYAYGKPCTGAEELLAEALPNTVQKYHIEHSTAGGWRKLDGYFEMRDIMGMFYLQ